MPSPCSPGPAPEDGHLWVKHCLSLECLQWGVTGSASAPGSKLRNCPCTSPGEAAAAAWEHPGMGKQGGCDTLSPSAEATRAHLSELWVLAGSEPTILSKQAKTLLLRLRLALQRRQVPAVRCLSPGCNVDQTLGISRRGCLHHTACPEAVVLLSWWVVPMGLCPGPSPPWSPQGQSVWSWTPCRCLHSPLHWAMALACIRHPYLHVPLQVADCTLVKRLFSKGLSTLFAIMQSPSPPVHGCVTAQVANGSAAYVGEKSWQGWMQI